MSNAFLIVIFTILASVLSLATVRSSISMSGGQFGKLYYFDARGAGEMSRILLKIGGKDFEDIRYSIKIKEGGGFETPEFQEAKLSGVLAVNMDRAPIFVTGSGVKIGQSKSIERYIAKKCNFLGNDDDSSAVIDCICENVRDIREKFGKIRMTGGFGPNPEKEAAMKKWYEEELSSWFTKLEKSLPASEQEGYSVGTSLSYADVCIWYLINEQFDDKEAVKAALVSCPKITQISAHVGSIECLQTYLRDRPQSMF